MLTVIGMIATFALMVWMFVDDVIIKPRRNRLKLEERRRAGMKKSAMMRAARRRAS